MKFCRHLILLTTLCSCGSQTPEEVVWEYDALIADCECEKARELTIEQAADMVQGIIDAGCVKYPSRLYRVKCNEIEDEARCTCYYKEKNEIYRFWDMDLIRVDGVWKITTIAYEPNK